MEKKRKVVWSWLIGPRALGAFEEWLRKKSQKGWDLAGRRPFVYVFEENGGQPCDYAVVHRSERANTERLGEKVDDWGPYAVYRSREPIPDREMDTEFLRKRWRLIVLLAAVAACLSCYLIADRARPFFSGGDWVRPLFWGIMDPLLGNVLLLAWLVPLVGFAFLSLRKMAREGNHYTLRAYVWVNVAFAVVALPFLALAVGVASVDTSPQNPAGQIDPVAIQAMVNEELGAGTCGALSLTRVDARNTRLLTRWVQGSLYEGEALGVQYESYESALIPLEDVYEAQVAEYTRRADVGGPARVRQSADGSRTVIDAERGTTAYILQLGAERLECVEVQEYPVGLTRRE